MNRQRVLRGAAVVVAGAIASLAMAGAASATVFAWPDPGPGYPSSRTCEVVAHRVEPAAAPPAPTAADPAGGQAAAVGAGALGGAALAAGALTLGRWRRLGAPVEAPDLDEAPAEAPPGRPVELLTL